MLESKNDDKDSERETQLCQMIESTYKVFGEINQHLRKVIAGGEDKPVGNTRDYSVNQKERPKADQVDHHRTGSIDD
jgi:hypothetical protein